MQMPVQLARPAAEEDAALLSPREDDRTMSFDIFLQSFAGGQAADGDPDAAFGALEPYLARSPTGGFAHLVTPDGEADVFGIGQAGLMINHASGEFIWQVMLDAALAGHYAIMPVGCPACIVREDMRDDLPDSLQATAVVVRSGTDVMNVVINA
jgi:hypothetical protein